MARALTPTMKRTLAVLAAANDWVEWTTLYDGPAKAHGTALGRLFVDRLAERSTRGTTRWRITEAGRKAFGGEGSA